MGDFYLSFQSIRFILHRKFPRSVNIFGVQIVEFSSLKESATPKWNHQKILILQMRNLMGDVVKFSRSSEFGDIIILKIGKHKFAAIAKILPYVTSVIK